MNTLGQLDDFFGVLEEQATEKPVGQLLDKISIFHRTLVEISARLVRVQPGELHQEISESLKHVGEFWGFDKIILVDITGEDKQSDLYYYTGPGISPTKSDSMVFTTPLFDEQLSRGRAVYFPNLPDDLPLEETVAREYFIKEGVKSLLVLPLIFNESLRGIISFVSISSSFHWNQDTVKEFFLVGEVMASALERRKIIVKSEEHLTFEQFLSEISAAYINLPVNEIEKRIRKDLGRLAMLLSGDRCVLYFPNEDKTSFSYKAPFVWWPEEENDLFNGDAKYLALLDSRIKSNIDFFGRLNYIFEKWCMGECVQWTNIDELPEEAWEVKDFYHRCGVKSYFSIPITVAGSTVCALVLVTTHNFRVWPQNLIPRLRLFGEVFQNAIIRKQAEESLNNALSEIKELKEQAESDYFYLNEEINYEQNLDNMIGQSHALSKIFIKAQKVAPTNATVLILGETGTGKGVMARAIHNASLCKDRPLVQVNCAALASTLIESELFGYEKGAFTGANTRRIGRFEVANGTSLFLDEIGDLPIDLQVKLLRVLQDGEFERVGGSTTIKTNVRIIAATNKDLEKEIKAGRFRSDLWYRLNLFPLYIPPLRERVDDIPLLVNYFVNKYSKLLGREFQSITQKTIRALQDYRWPGNIRELENIIERAIITSPEGRFIVEIPGRSADEQIFSDLDDTLDEIDRKYITKMLEKSDWTVEGSSGAAKRLGLAPSTLRYQLKRLGIKRPGKTRVIGTAGS